LDVAEVGRGDDGYERAFASLTGARRRPTRAILAQVQPRSAADHRAGHPAATPGDLRGGHMADEGGLMAYGPTQAEMDGCAAGLVDKILKGAPPGDRPIEQPTKFELVVNLKTAKTLALALPPAFLARADRLVE